ncbi:MAG: hypothetical protein EOO73_10185 [Myxococcales bacterium]|nr:MAG: hypothetical protein EOO73_10185 [Myxococcales bacterium]
MKRTIAIYLASSLCACSSNDAEPPSVSLPSAGANASAGMGGAAQGGALFGGAGAGAVNPGGTNASGAAATGGAAGSDAGAPSGAGASVQGGAAGSAGSATGAGGSAGGGVSGAAGAAGSGNLCPPHAQVCLDFESGDYPGWNKKESGGTITVDGAHARHGQRSLLITTPANQRGGMIENHGAPLFPLPSKKMWGRVMVYFEGVPDGHTDLIRGSAANGGPNYNVGEQHDSIMLNYYAGSRATDCWARPKPEKKVPDQTWMCWEWSFDSANNAVEYWLDGALLRSVNGTGDGCLEGNGVWKAPASFESVSVGEQIAELSPNTAFKLWVDDVAVSNTERVGCP